MIRSALMTVINAAVTKAGRGLKRDFGEVEHLQVSVKGPGDFVTAADKRSEKVLFEELSKARPGYGFIMEESGSVEGTDPSHTWHIDPLDGTTNFLHGLPLFAISVGLEREGEIVAGMIYNPATDDMFFAEKGQGAFLNNRRLRVSARRDLAEALIANGTPPLARSHLHGAFKHESASVMALTGGLRAIGSAALNMGYVAAGRFDAYWERGVKTWDVAAGAIIVREAGGFVGDADGRDKFLDTDSICCGNEHIHRLLLSTLKTSRIRG